MREDVDIIDSLPFRMDLVPMPSSLFAAGCSIEIRKFSRMFTFRRGKKTGSAEISPPIRFLPA
jgi:hypothetical protein